MSDAVLTVTRADVQRAAQAISAALPGINPDTLAGVVENWLSDAIDALIAGAPYFAVTPGSGFSRNFFDLLSGETKPPADRGGEQLTQTAELAALEDVVAAWQQDARDWLDEFGPALPYPHHDMVADLEDARDARAEA